MIRANPYILNIWWGEGQFGGVALDFIFFLQSMQRTGHCTTTSRPTRLTSDRYCYGQNRSRWVRREGGRGGERMREDGLLTQLWCCAGMNYLHCGAPVPVIHRDLKSKNGINTAQHVRTPFKYFCPYLSLPLSLFSPSPPSPVVIVSDLTAKVTIFCSHPLYTHTHLAIVLVGSCVISAPLSSIFTQPRYQLLKELSPGWRLK